MKAKIHQLLILLATILNASMALALGPDTADVHFSKYSNPINITVSQGGSTGCPAGQNWDIVVGRCTPAVGIKTLSTSQSCSCSCPSGSTGSCTASQSGSYVVYGWRLPTSGTQLVSYNGPVSWGSCSETSNSCVADGGTGPTGPAPPSGTSFTVEAFICNSSHPSYNSGPLDTASKNFIISTYRKFNSGSRCAELRGYVFWQSSWSNWATEYQGANPGATFAMALAATKLFPTSDAMNRAAAENGENNPAINGPILNSFCSSYASQKYGVPLTATYVNDSGSTCVVN